MIKTQVRNNYVKYQESNLCSVFVTSLGYISHVTAFSGNLVFLVLHACTCIYFPFLPIAILSAENCGKNSIQRAAAIKQLILPSNI